MYSNVLKEVMELEDVKDLCVTVDCKEIVFPLCFIRKETLKYLVVDSTADDGTEKVVVIPKDNILSVNVVYQQDIDRLFEVDGKDEKMFG